MIIAPDYITGARTPGPQTLTGSRKCWKIIIRNYSAQTSLDPSAKL